MKTEQEMRKTLYDMAAMFEHHIFRQEYLKASLTADYIGEIGVFVGLDDKTMTELLGDRQPDEPVEGIVKEALRIKAMHWCVMNGYAHSYHTYQNVRKLL